MMYITGLILNEFKDEKEFTQQTIRVAKISYLHSMGSNSKLGIFYCLKLNDEHECAKFMVVERGISISNKKP